MCRELMTEDGSDESPIPAFTDINWRYGEIVKEPFLTRCEKSFIFDGACYEFPFFGIDFGIVLMQGFCFGGFMRFVDPQIEYYEGGAVY